MPAEASTDAHTPETTPSGSARRFANYTRRFRLWAQRVGFERRAAYVLAAAAILAGLGTYAVFTRAGPAGPNPDVVLGILYLDFSLLLLLGVLVAWRMARLWVERRQGLAGSRLHVRLVVMFSVLTVAPTILVSVFSLVMFDFGIRSWFSERVSTAVTGSVAVAERYLEEHRQVIRGDVLAMANDINREAPFLVNNPARFSQVLRAQAALRNLTEAVVFDNTGRVLARTSLALSFDYEPLPEAAMAKAQLGDVVVLTTDAEDRLRAVVRLDRFVDAYLFVGRFVDAEILSYIERTKEAVNQFTELEGRRFDIQVSFIMIFAMVALLLLLAAVWIGLNLATRMVHPISDLIGAAERISAGDLSARVAGPVEADEMGLLARAFNRMTRQLEMQRGELMSANRQIDARRRFTEAVLGGVSAGVIGLDAEARINLPNRSAASLLGVDGDSLVGRTLSEQIPEMSELLEVARRNPYRQSEKQIELNRGDRKITLLARIKAEITEGEVSGYVLTFDDISELLSAQRMAAWADVARRIAHEIKNPLTPIQLSAERLKRKYLKQIETDPETFVECTDTIVRQVGDIGRMVDEFSAFARMPAPVMRKENLIELIRGQVVLQRSAQSGIVFEFDEGQEPVEFECDQRQIRQVLTNLLQNAIDAIQASGPTGIDEEGGTPAHRVSVTVGREDQRIIVDVEDTGRGLPDKDRDRLTEPYVTTREKGTGLGLAIVKRIMEDHAGSITLMDREGGGTKVRLTFRDPADARGEDAFSESDQSVSGLSSHGA
ncbi:MAG: PAS domain-containing sensor histidine kinase [Nisaea sp.]|uniref:sensor histidine kinase NtrY-like n=1 Tax=Nisaea sp. TaxID=2024842 RepID=UPI001B14F253|nr:PAS domain-containing sensor histidine kinase [Nisaea sp.]MBO6559028.1 PAS domain-containing sensor histidine kinase [Nisaea sp.]